MLADNKKIIITSVIVLFLIVVIFLLFKKENYHQLMTLGNFGKAEPASCLESEPAIRYKNLYVCNACSLGCSSKESWDKCEECQRNLSMKDVGVM